jgi:Ca-activated chloride channel family protein
MPTQGSQVNLALDKAGELFEQSGFKNGEIILLTDGMAFPELCYRTAAALKAKSIRLSVLAVGTETGSPIPLDGGGFLKDASGAIVIPKLDQVEMRTLAQKGGGRIALLSHDDKDINFILADDGLPGSLSANRKTGLTGDVWREEGPWLVLLVLPLALLSFRKGWPALLILCLPWAQPGYAMQWQDWWWTQDQQAAKAMKKKDYEKAAELFNDPAWKAAAEYKAGDYENAVKNLSQMDDAEAIYNRGNALARLGRYQEAIQAYEQALEKQADHQDAKFNRDFVESLLEKQQQESQSSKDSQDKNKDKQQDQNQDKQQQADQQDAQNQSSDQKSSANDSEQAPSKENGSDQQDQQQSSSQQQAEQDAQKTKQQQAEAQQAEEKKQQEKAEAEAHAQKNQKQQTGDKKQTQAMAQEQKQDQQTAEEKEIQQAVQQWLRQIPDDPGGLLREKFRRKSIRQQRAGGDQGPAW